MTSPAPPSRSPHATADCARHPGRAGRRRPDPGRATDGGRADPAEPGRRGAAARPDPGPAGQRAAAGRRGGGRAGRAAAAVHRRARRSPGPGRSGSGCRGWCSASPRTRSCSWSGRRTCTWPSGPRRSSPTWSSGPTGDRARTRCRPSSRSPWSRRDRRVRAAAGPHHVGLPGRLPVGHPDAGTPPPSAGSTCRRRRSSAWPGWCSRTASTCSGTRSGSPPATWPCCCSSPPRCAGRGRSPCPTSARLRLRSARLRKLAAGFVVFIGWLYLVPQLQGAGLTVQTVTGGPYAVGALVVAVVVTAERGPRRHAGDHLRAGLPVLAQADRAGRTGDLPGAALAGRRAAGGRRPRARRSRPRPPSP